MGVFFVLPLQDWERSGKLFWILALQRMFQAERAEKIKDDMETSNKKESFDLLESLIGFSRWVKRSLTCFFRWAGMAVVWVFRMQIRYFFVFLILLAGLCIWSYLGKEDESVRTEYVGSAYVSCNGFDNFVLDQFVSKLDMAVKSKDTSFLAESLALPAKEVLMLKGLRMGVGFDLDDDGIPNQIRFEKKFAADEYEKGEILSKRKEGQVIERRPKTKKIPGQAVIEIKTALVAKDTFSMLSSAVLGYFNRNADLRRMHEIYRDGLGFLLQSYNGQIKMLDSLQCIEYIENSRKQKIAQGRDLYMTAMLTSSRDLTVEDVERLTGPNVFYHEDILELVEGRNKVQAQYDMAAAPVTVLSDFVPVKQVGNQPWFLWALFMAIVLTSMLGALWEYRRQIFAYVRQQRVR